MDQVSITTTEHGLELRTPYHPDFRHDARQVGGDYKSGRWVFDPRDEARVRELAVRYFGTDGTPGPVVDVRITGTWIDRQVSSQRGGEALYAFGRMIAERKGRDLPVKLGKHVVTLAGGFPGRGGSVANPALSPERGTVLEVRDVPAAHPDLAKYADEVEVITPTPAEEAPAEEAPDVEALRAERARLLARVAEIDEQLTAVQ